MNNHSATEDRHQLSEAEIRNIAALLRKLEPGFLPLELFLQFTRLMVSSIIEVVPLRLVGTDAEVLLLPRDGNDPVWGGLLHTPGTVLRPTDASLETALQRLLDEELPGISSSQAVFVEHRLHTQDRGRELSLVYWVEVQTSIADGTFSSVSALPTKLVSTQRPFIEAASRHFVRTKRGAGKNTHSD